MEEHYLNHSTLAYTNTYLLASSNMGGLATYNAFAGYQELVGRMFGSFIEFKWNRATKQLNTIYNVLEQKKKSYYNVITIDQTFQLLDDYMAMYSGLKIIHLQSVSIC